MEIIILIIFGLLTMASILSGINGIIHTVKYNEKLAEIGKRIDRLEHSYDRFAFQTNEDLSELEDEIDKLKEKLK